MEKDQTPLMRQYLSIKEEAKDAILFFRMGDFYEMFNEDAVAASKILGITLTARDKKNDNPIPLCGFPHFALENHLPKLLKEGYKVAICEQVEDPKTAKGLVKREIIRTISPGTITSAHLLEEGSNHYLVSLIADFQRRVGLAVVDLSTGDFQVTEFEDSPDWKTSAGELTRLEPKEILIPGGSPADFRKLVKSFGIPVEILERGEFEHTKAYRRLTEGFKVINLKGFGCDDKLLAIAAGGGAMGFIEETLKGSCSHIHRLSYYCLDDHIIIDPATRRNLELIRSSYDGSAKGTLLDVINFCQTSMGSRMLKNRLLHPLIDPEAINRRLDLVEAFSAQSRERAGLRKLLKRLQDLERLISRLCLSATNARDLVALKNSLAQIPEIKEILSGFNRSEIQQVNKELPDLPEIVAIIEGAIVDDPPLTVKEGGLLKPGVSREVDELRELSCNSKAAMAGMEKSERKATGINTLKIKYNKVFGYYIEITNTNLGQVPDHYIRKQTLVNAERFITPELKEYETKLLNAEEELNNLEYEFFLEIRKEVIAAAPKIQAASKKLAETDCQSALAELAALHNYSRPLITGREQISIKDGRHPVVERLTERFIPNDCLLDDRENRLLLITGPNMAGKSTYMRQVALLVLLAQMGSFIPASAAEIGVIKQIFTRVGASDILSQGMSTFMVEMTETANIVNNAGPGSLIIIDEIGRGTSTYDGVSIAGAVAEYLSEKPGLKTLFATHYHELTDLETRIQGIKNLNVAVKESEREIVFLYKIVPGHATSSYGIQVARLAGLPDELIGRSLEILNGLEDRQLKAQMLHRSDFHKKRKRSRDSETKQLNLFSGVKR